MKRDNALKNHQVLEIVRRYPNEKAATIAADFNVNVKTIYKTAQRYMVHKSEAFRASEQSGRIQKGQRVSVDTEFKAGCQSATKGKRMEAFIKNEEKLKKWKAGLWKKGNKPHNTATDGEIRWRKNPGFYFIRISEQNWEFLHRHLWQQHKGPIPKGYNVVFSDRNRRNCTIENLECISNEELALRNSIHRYPKELVSIIKLKGKLNRQIIKQNEEQTQ
jgi:hypothetical protein